jgi:hypothetical protein
VPGSGPGARQVIVATREDLRLLAEDRRAYWRLHGREIVLAPSEERLHDDERRPQLAKLNTALDECGCSLGAALSIAGASAALGLCLVRDSGLIWTSLLTLCALVGMGVLGKTLGLLRARRVFRRECAQVLARLESPNH